MNSPKVYQAIAACMADIAKAGIAKNRKNEQQNYKFRGIDDVYNALAPILAEHHLTIIPVIQEREVVERINAKGTALFYVTVRADFHVTSAEDGSTVTATTYGEAMDSGDKATNKAMSAAYKYMAMQVFCIPTEGDNDADATTHEIQASGYVTKAEAAHIKAEAEKVGANVAAFLGMLKAKSFEEIRAADYEGAMAALAKKAAKVNAAPMAEAA